MPAKIIRSINFTGRQKIPRDRINITPKADGTFDANINLDGMKLAETSEVSLEAWDRFSMMCFDLGTVGNIRTIQNQHLDDIQRKDRIHFSVKVTETGSEHGKILAHYDNIHTVEKENRDCILHVKIDDIGDQIWKVHFDEDGPILYLNNRLAIPNVRELVSKDPVFQSLVFPAIVKEILVRILINESDYDLDDHDDWRSKWLLFICKIIHQEEPPEPIKENGYLQNEDELVAWITDDAIPEYCRFFSWKAKYDDFLRGDTNDN